MKNYKKKDLELFATKLTEKNPDPSNAEELSFLFEDKKRKISKTIKIITQQRKDRNLKHY